ncbi:MAG: sigma-70 family RNA polymerase sigma factor, partial [Clostridia bacterium]|nr:sigma-70 family RNA polymerase sigma factor [Clostridia bacterium]
MDKECLYDIEELWEQYFSTGDETVKNQIITHYLYIVTIVVKRLMPQYKDFSEKDELMSCGVIGLIDAVNKFDRTFGVQFQTYATIRIRGEIIDYLRKQDWAPTSLRKKISEIQDAYEKLENMYDRRPSEQEIADYLGIKVASVRKVLQKAHMFNLVYFESMLYEQGSDEIEGAVQDEPYSHIEKESMSEALLKLVATLPEREKMIIT